MAHREEDGQILVAVSEMGQHTGQFLHPLNECGIAGSPPKSLVQRQQQTIPLIDHVSLRSSGSDAAYRPKLRVVHIGAAGKQGR